MKKATDREEIFAKDTSAKGLLGKYTTLKTQHIRKRMTQSKVEPTHERRHTGKHLQDEMTLYVITELQVKLQ